MSNTISLKIKSIEKTTKDSIKIEFKENFFNKVKYSAGQFLTLLLEIDKKIYRRCYSLNSAMKIDPYPSITVKRVDNGLVSNYLFENAKEGQKIKALTPMGDFTIEPKPDKERHIVLFGAGSGITPLFSILKTILFKEGKSKVSLVYGNRDYDSIIFNEELNQLKKQYPERLQLQHILENPGDFEECYKGRVQRTQVKSILEQLPQLPEDRTEYYICGPTGMMIEAEEGLKSCDVPPGRIHIERFNAPPALAKEEAKAPEIEDQQVKLIYKGKEHSVDVKAGTSILDAALDQKIKLPYVCMDGICGTCKGQCKTGDVYMRNGHVLSEADMNDGKVLLCMSKPVTDDVVIEVL